MASNNDEYNRGGLIALVGSVSFCLLFFIYVSFIHPGIDLKEVPKVDPNAAPAFDITSVAKPWEGSPDLIAHGQKVFKNNCAVCHGDSGKGDGAAGASLNPPPRNLVEGKWKVDGSLIGLYKTLQNGIPGTSMASFKHIGKNDRWAVVHFIHSITLNKVADDPAKLAAFGATAE